MAQSTGAGPAGPRAVRGSRRERNKQEKLERIVAAAHRLFSEKGFAETTTQEIAEAADIGSGTLFLYAKSKEDLLVLVFKDEMIAMAGSLYPNVDRTLPLLEQLLAVFTGMLNYHRRDVGISRALIKELTVLSNPERRRDLQDLMRVIYGGLVDLLLQAQMAGTIRPDVAPLHAAQFLFFTYYMVLQAWVGGYLSNGRVESRLRLNLRLALQGLTPRPKRQALRPGDPGSTDY